MESPPDPAKSKDDSKDTKSTNPDVKNRGWPKGKKRYPKSPGAPKQPLSGYVHFLNDRRETVRKETPEMSFADISKKLANEWSQLGHEEKQRYVERAEIDKERYSREFQNYQQTNEYKEFVAQQEAAKKANGEVKSGPSSSKKAKKSKKKDNETVISNEDSRSSSTSSEIPIFRDEFLELNKARETELRSLRKTVSEFEEQNAVLQKHVDNLRSAATKLERDIALTKENTQSLDQQLNGMKSLVRTHLSRFTSQVPNFEQVTDENVEDFAAKLLVEVQSNSQLLEAVKSATSKIDFSPFSSTQKLLDI